MFRTASFSPALASLLLSGGVAAAPTAEPPVMFRGNPEHSGVSEARFFSGQGGIKWRVETGGAVRSSPAVTSSRVFVGSGDGFGATVERLPVIRAAAEYGLLRAATLQERGSGAI
jgi:hypothetical protein